MSLPQIIKKNDWMTMKDLLDFYLRLSLNNNKAWLDAHRDEYEESKKMLASFAMEFIAGVEAFDPRCKNLQPRDCTYRINRDIRFSADKRPYKDWHGVYVCPGGKKSGMAGYYIHFEPVNELFFLSGGLYNPTKEVLQSVREHIMLEPQEFHEAVIACGNDFTLNWDGALKRMPKGYNEADPHSEYYRLKSFEVYKSLTLDDVLDKDFLPKALSHLKRCQEFNELLNNCVDYANDLD